MNMRNSSEMSSKPRKKPSLAKRSSNMLDKQENKDFSMTLIRVESIMF